MTRSIRIGRLTLLAVEAAGLLGGSLALVPQAAHATTTPAISVSFEPTGCNMTATLNWNNGTGGSGTWFVAVQERTTGNAKWTDEAIMSGTTSALSGNQSVTFAANSGHKHEFRADGGAYSATVATPPATLDCTG